MRLVFFVLITLLASSVGAQERAAPFGLFWLASPAEVRDLGVSLQELETIEYGQTYSASNLPKALSDMDVAILSFGYDDRLYRIVALGRDNRNDAYGVSVLARYEALARSLSESYGPGVEYHRRSTDSYFGKPENFAYGISKRENAWFTTFSSDGIEVELSIRSSHEDTFWGLIYTHLRAEADFKSQKTASETDAL